jgi:hypothetical protein
VEGLEGVIRAAALAACVLAAPATLAAQAPEAAPPSASTAAQPSDTGITAGTIAKFLAGGAAGLGIHESGHLLFGTLLEAAPGVKGVSFGPLPFFAITHDDVSPPREYTIAASGFWMHHASSEWLLTRRPRLRHEQAPFAKGILAFNVVASGAYATAAFGRFGPYERDTRAMAAALDVGEPWVGAMILAPAVLDTWRYVRPGSRWAVWTSRAVKAGALLVVIRAAQ